MVGKRRGKGGTGRLRIGDDWNAITIIATSQSNPLKAVAEFVENSIDADASSHVGFYRAGTRVLESISALDAFRNPPWISDRLQGIVDVPFLNLTPGTRTGIIHDDALEALKKSMAPMETALIKIIDEQRKAEESHASRKMLRTIQKAFAEALLALPAEEYDWFDIQRKNEAQKSRGYHDHEDAAQDSIAIPDGEMHRNAGENGQKQFFEFAGPLFSLRISPACPPRSCLNA